MIGERVGKHSILAEIGRGGMGTVYKAEDNTLGRKVAIKLLNPSLLGKGGKELERFQSEAKIQANLNHPNIVTLHDIQPYQDSYYIVMEFVEGRTLAHLVKSSGPMPPHIAVTISRQVLEALAAAHRHKVVHRDLKPANIMLTSEGLAKVMDFGIAKGEGSKHLTATGAIVGTVSYMSPEQVRGEMLDARSDIYSFGIILFELLTGRVPFKADSDFSIMVQHVQTTPPPPTQLLPEIPTALEDIVLKCLEKDPKSRFQTAQEVIAALDAFEERQRTLGLGQLYTKASLAHWLASPDDVTPISEAAAVSSEDAISLPPLPESRSEVPLSAAQSSKKISPKVWLVLPGILILVAAAVAYFWTMEREPANSAAEKSIPASGPTISITDPSPSPIVMPQEQDATATETDPAPPATKPPAAVLTPPPAAAEPAIPEEPAQAPVAEAAKAIILFLNLDESGENLPLGMAQARITEMLREAGHQVVSSNMITAHVRTSLDTGDLKGVRDNGIGYVLMGTAHGSLEPQDAYGRVYYAGRVSFILELVQTSDGRVSSTSRADSRSRGSENPEVALRDALLTAVSDATRTLLGNFNP